MSNILGLEKLHDYLSSAESEKLIKGADRHADQSNMSFTVLSANEHNLEIEVVQTETKSGKYATATTLASRTQELFKNFFPNSELTIHPVTYAPSPASIVTTQWIDAKMQQKGVRIKQVAYDTGIDKESISDWVTGKKSMSQIVKAMFYFYLSK